MRIVFTGGHFSPAYSVIQKIKGKDELLVIGRRYAFEGDNNETYEYKICKREGLPFEELVTGRLQRKFTKYTIPSMVKFPRGVLEAFTILKKFRPDVVVTFGGYIGLPVAIAASFLNIPVVLHEQTQKTGLSARLISKMANVVCLSFDSSKKYFKNKNVIVTGNPLREEIFENQALPQYISKPFIYITGGSTGAHAINNAVYSILSELLKEVMVVHQTGNSKEYKDYEALSEFKKKLPSEYSKKYVVSQFFGPQEVASFFQNAQLVVSRAGANTVLELMATGAVAILIPLPYGQKSEQKENALLLEKVGLGKILDQENLSGENLTRLIHDMIRERDIYEKNKQKASQLVVRDAAENLIEQIYHYGRGSKGNTP